MEIAEIYAIAKGEVQGVGFRASTQRIALEYHLKGSVKNLPDGTVEIYAQGPKETLLAFCSKLNQRWEGYLIPLTPMYLEKLNFYEEFVVKR